MKIAVDLSFGFYVSVYREGITVYNNFLFDSLLKLSPENKIEFWADAVNKEDFFKCYQNLFDNYPDQTSVIFNEDELAFKQKIKTSNADIVFLDCVRFEHAHYSSAPKVFMLHDLFTIPLRDLFYQSVPNIDFINTAAVSNLSLYAKNRAFFVINSMYIRDNHLFKYVQNISPDKTNIISYPPMLRTFKTENILSEEEFKSKFNITTPYMPYPSQNRTNKNLIVILRALKRLKEKNIKITLVTTGRIGMVASNLKYVSENDIQDMILETGSLSEQDLYALYKYANLTVVPTIIEGPGMPQQTLETLMLKGIPVIHAKSWGIKESLESVGLAMETADLNWFELDDDEALALKIEEVLNNPTSHIEKQRHILAAYTKRTWEDTARDYMKVFEIAIAENKKHPCPALDILPNFFEIPSLDPLISNTLKMSKKKKFFGFYRVKFKDGKKIKRYAWGLIRKEKSPFKNKIYFCGLKIYFIKTKENKKIFSFLGIPFYKRVIRNGKKKGYLFGIRIYKKRINAQKIVESVMSANETHPPLNNPASENTLSLDKEQFFLRMEGIKTLRERKRE